MPTFDSRDAPALRPAVIVYAVGRDLIIECVAAAKASEISCREVRHLQAACAALKMHDAPMVVASTSLKPWDRIVLEEHALQAGAELRWVSGTDLFSIGDEIERWANESSRARQRIPVPARTPPRRS